MSKKTSYFIIVVLVIIACAIFLKAQTNIRVGFGVKDEIVLKNGDYRELNLTGQFAVIAVSGEGRIDILRDKEKIEISSLTTTLYNDVKLRAPQVLNQVLFEEGKKINLIETDRIIVDGTEEFEVKLIQR